MSLWSRTVVGSFQYGVCKTYPLSRRSSIFPNNIIVSNVSLVFNIEFNTRTPSPFASVRISEIRNFDTANDWKRCRRNIIGASLNGFSCFLRSEEICCPNVFATWLEYSRRWSLVDIDFHTFARCSLSILANYDNNSITLRSTLII